MDAFDAIGVDLVRKNREIIERAGILVLDGNLPEETLRVGVEIAKRNNVPGEF